MKAEQMWGVSKSSGTVHRWRRVNGWWRPICGARDNQGDLQEADAGTCKRCVNYLKKQSNLAKHRCKE
jgi:hypothetical protein